MYMHDSSSLIGAWLLPPAPEFDDADCVGAGPYLSVFRLGLLELISAIIKKKKHSYLLHRLPNVKL